MPNEPKNAKSLNAGEPSPGFSLGLLTTRRAAGVSPFSLFNRTVSG